LGLVDTAVIGHTGDTMDLGAIALGSLVFSFLYWSFGFLRMGTTGFVARADGAGEQTEIRATLGRALFIANGIGIVLVLLQWPICVITLKLISASDSVEEITRGYILARLWGAPASLSMFALLGMLVGLGQSGKLLRVQLFLNTLNILFDALFAGYLGWGVRGIAFGTVLAEWIALVYAWRMVYALLQQRRQADQGFWNWAHIADMGKLKQTLQANTDILIRTLALLFGFGWFINQAARFGDSILAANHILLQFISLSAFILDGFAFATESMVGRAAGAGDRTRFTHVVYHASVLAAITAIIISLLLYIMGPWFITVLTDIAMVRTTAQTYLLFACIYVLTSFAAFQFDGIFIGTSRTRDMRNASLMSAGAFLLACGVLTPTWQNSGLWLAFIIFLLARAIALSLYYPALRKSIGH